METYDTKEFERRNAVWAYMRLSKPGFQMGKWGGYATGKEFLSDTSRESTVTGTGVFGPAVDPFPTVAFPVYGSASGLRVNPLNVGIDDWKEQDKQTSFADVEREAMWLKPIVRKDAMRRVLDFIHSEVASGPDGHFKIPHLWPGQNPPPRRQDRVY